MYKALITSERVSDSQSEYIRKPVAKRFSDEKPEKDGEYLAKGTHYVKSIWALDKHESNPWMQCILTGGIWYDGQGVPFIPEFWCEIITPDMPE